MYRLSLSKNPMFRDDETWGFADILINRGILE